MREYCLMNANGTAVLNMCTSGKPEGPVLTEYEAKHGWQWVPVSKVNPFALRKYRYWNERP